MDDLKFVVASNIINLRKEAKLTQAELAEKLNYSDKSVSKWERAESLPDVYVLKMMADIFGVSVDYIISSHDDWVPVPKKRILTPEIAKTITGITLVGIFLLAMIVFVVLWILGKEAWITFIYAMPVSIITLLVLHSIWGEGRFNYVIIVALIFSILASLYYTFFLFGGKNYWQLYLLLIPGIILVYLSKLLKRRGNKLAKDAAEA
ncbi:MAG: helix-turn-helix domain-containing protein [Lachnospiraceae bacterium]|nr:helix-turn-helix domain-containing protein [Lachnospiraceae bacterium]